MGLSQALWTGLTSLQSHQTWTDIIGQNISQINTTGFKYSNASFSDMLYSTINSQENERNSRGSINANQLGLGTQISSISQVFTPGNLELTNRTFDCAIDGGGMFVLGDTNSTDRYFSRNGSFYLSKPLGDTRTQNLQSADGLIVQGYQAVNGSISDTIGTITMPSLGTLLPGTPTSEITFLGNLNSTYPVVSGNTINTSAPGVTSGSWISDTAGTLNIGAVETSAALLNGTTGLPASGDTDLIELDFLRSANEKPLFGTVPSGYSVDSREITIDFTKGNTHYSETFTYGTDGTTLNDFATWLTGGIGDIGTPTTQRLDGGALGTVRTREYTVNGDGYAAPAEQAGGFYSYDESGSFMLNIASNLGSFNSISDINLTTTTKLTDSEGNTHNNILDYDDFFSENKNYKGDNKGGSAITSSEIFLPNPEGEGTVEEKDRYNFTLVSRDSNGSTWRWYADGDYASVDDDKLNKGTGIIRFGTTSKPGEQQVKDATVDGGTNYTFDFSEMTQLALDSSVTADQDGYKDGELKSYMIDQYGVIDGFYTNGYTDHLAQLVLAQVENSNGLEQIGNTLWKTNAVSGDPIYSTKENINMFGSVRSNHLESSNVNMANEMTKLLLSQRGYQLGSKIITTADDMLKEISNLKS